MAKTQDKKRKQDLGIFYTPTEVVTFVFNILNIWKKSQTARWGNKGGNKKYPSVIDPAVGEGIFLKTALTKNFTAPKYVFGVDIDEKVKEKWVEINLLKSFGSKAELNQHFFHQNGLLPLDEWKILRYKKGGLREFDAVVGNPPYGGVGLEEITPELEKALFDFQIWKLKSQRDPAYSTHNLGLFGVSIPEVYKKKIQNFPIEILFIDRFIQLAKHGGWISIIIPDGILTNSNSNYVREYLSKIAKIEAIISLPRDTFKNVGTNAKTSILFLRKLKKDEKTKGSYPVFLASINKIERDQFNSIVKSYEKSYNLEGNHMNNSNSIKVTKDQTLKEVIMVRVDKTLRELMEEKPDSRWDPNYWSPKYEKILSQITSSKYKILKGEEIIYLMTNGNRDREWASGVDNKIRFVQVVNVLNTGVNYEAGDKDKHYARTGGLGDPARSRLKTDDILLISGATGSIGRACVLNELPEPVNVSQDINIIRLKPNSKINKYYFVVYLLSYFGSSQLERYSKGVSGQIKVTFEHIKSVVIPILPPTIQENISEGYKKMGLYHNKAMEAIKQSDEKGYKEYLRTAEGMLRDLIKKTEEVIEGKREDVN